MSRSDLIEEILFSLPLRTRVEAAVDVVLAAKSFVGLHRSDDDLRWNRTHWYAHFQ